MNGRNTDSFLQVVFIIFQKAQRSFHFSVLPFEYVGVKGEEAVEGVGAGLHKVAPGAAPHNGDELPVVPLYNCVAEHQLVFPLKKGIKKR